MTDEATPTTMGSMKPHERKALVEARREEAKRIIKEQEETARRAKLIADNERRTKASEHLRNLTNAKREDIEAVKARRMKPKEERFADRERLQEEADLVLGQACREESVFPVRLGNLYGPEGNVWNVIAAVKAGIRWAEQQNVVLPEEAYEIVRHFRERKYDETLVMIEALSLDLDDSFAAYWAGENGEAPGNDLRRGDNPIGAFFGQ